MKKQYIGALAIVITLVIITSLTLTQGYFITPEKLSVKHNEIPVTGYVFTDNNEAYIRTVIKTDKDLQNAIVYLDGSMVNAKIRKLNPTKYLVTIPVQRNSEKTTYSVRFELPDDTLAYKVVLAYAPVSVDDIYYIKYRVESDISKFAKPSTGYSLELPVDREYGGIDVKILDTENFLRDVRFEYEYIQDADKKILKIHIDDIVPKEGSVLIWLGDFEPRGQLVSHIIDENGIVGYGDEAVLMARRYVRYAFAKDKYIKIYGARFSEGSSRRPLKGGDYLSLFVGKISGVRRISVTLQPNETSTVQIRSYVMRDGILFVLEADTHKFYILKVSSYVPEQTGVVDIDDIIDWTYNPYVGAHYYIFAPYGEEVLEDNGIYDGEWDGIVGVAIEQAYGYKIIPALFYDACIDSLPENERLYLVISVYDTAGNGVYFRYSGIFIDNIDEEFIYLLHTSVNGVSTLFFEVDAQLFS